MATSASGVGTPFLSGFGVNKPTSLKHVTIRRPPSLDQHQRFFRELVPRLATARELERELDAHLARRFNVFDYLPTHEMGLSRIVADLLDPKGKHGQGASFLKLLIDECSIGGLTSSNSAMFTDVEVEV